MTIFSKTLRCSFSLAVAIASASAFVWTLALVAARQISSFDALILLDGSALAAVVFTLRAIEAYLEYQPSVTKMSVKHTHVQSGTLIPRRAEA
jgi:hypothetical protein